MEEVYLKITKKNVIKAIIRNIKDIDSIVGKGYDIEIDWNNEVVIFNQTSKIVGGITVDCTFDELIKDYFGEDMVEV